MQDIHHAILSIAVLASFADGKKAEVEREQIRNIMESLQTEGTQLDLAKLYQDVLLKRIDLATAAASITDHSHRQLAYEMAVCVCDADGVMTGEEQRFLQELKSHLQLDDVEAEKIAEPAHAIAAASTIAAVTHTEQPAKAATISVSSVPEAELDKSILNYAILNGALELLPQSWASMAIIPLQIKWSMPSVRRMAISLIKAISLSSSPLQGLA